MAKVSIAIQATAALSPLPPGMEGDGEVQAIFAGDGHPIHAYLHTIAAGGHLRIGAGSADYLGYVWTGAIVAGGEKLAAGSSLIVEHGATLAMTAGDNGALLVWFAAPRPSRAGGHVHLLPAQHVPYVANIGGASQVRGKLHADAGCLGCELWLHENRFPAAAIQPDSVQASNVHSHSEDEVIFITEGHIRLGNRLFGPGTAIAIRAETFYGFTVGPDGLGFINFRAGLPGQIRFGDGGMMDEVGPWHARIDRPLRYLEPA